MDAPIEPHEAISFLTLPLEIRTQIYMYALKRDSISFYPIRKTHEDPDSNTPTYSVHRPYDFEHGQGGDWKTQHKLCRNVKLRNLGDCPDSLSIGILYTCRQVHAEASQILWSKNTFHFQRLTTFAKIITVIGQSNRAALRSLSLRIPWTNVWDYKGSREWLVKAFKPLWNLESVLKDSQGLRALRLEIDFEGYYFAYEIEKMFNDMGHGDTNTSNVLTSLPLELVEVILEKGLFSNKHDDLSYYCKRIEDLLIGLFTPKPDKHLYQPPRINVAWETKLQRGGASWRVLSEY